MFVAVSAWRSDPGELRYHHPEWGRSGPVRASVVASVRHRSLRQQCPLLERTGVLLLHGNPPVDHVLHGRLARWARKDLDDWGTGVHCQYSDRVYRVSLADELRLPVDRCVCQDPTNSVGVGGFFNPLNFGQMYTYHVFVFPAAIAAIIAIHILLVRLRGVVRPYPGRGEQREPYRKDMTQAEHYHGVRMAPYDLIREITVLGVVVLALVVLFAGVFSSGDERPLTLQSVAQSDPVGFTNVSLSELDGSSAIAGYGQPYNTATGATQSLVLISFQQLAGVSIPIDTAQVYVYGPLATIHSASVQAAVATYKAASADQQTKWTTAYSAALAKSASPALDANGALVLPAGDYGPLPLMFNALLAGCVLARWMASCWRVAHSIKLITPSRCSS